MLFLFYFDLFASVCRVSYVVEAAGAEVGRLRAVVEVSH